MHPWSAKYTPTASPRTCSEGRKGPRFVILHVRRWFFRSLFGAGDKKRQLSRSIQTTKNTRLPLGDSGAGSLVLDEYSASITRELARCRHTR